MQKCGQVVNKENERKIRSKIIRILDGNCTECFTRTNNYSIHGQIYAYKYCNETCVIGQKLQLLGQSLGDTKSPLWSNDEVNYLLHHHELFSIDHLADRLERTPEAVEIKLRRLLDPKRKKRHASTI